MSFIKLFCLEFIGDWKEKVIPLLSAVITVESVLILIITEISVSITIDASFSCFIITLL